MIECRDAQGSASPLQGVAAAVQEGGSCMHAVIRGGFCVAAPEFSPHQGSPGRLTLPAHLQEAKVRCMCLTIYK